MRRCHRTAAPMASDNFVPAANCTCARFSRTRSSRDSTSLSPREEDSEREQPGMDTMAAEPQLVLLLVILIAIAPPSRARARSRPCLAACDHFYSRLFAAQTGPCVPAFEHYGKAHKMTFGAADRRGLD